MPTFQTLYTSRFLAETFGADVQYKRDTFTADTRFYDAQKQVAINNQLAYNSFLHINQEQALDLKRLAFDKADIRRMSMEEVAKQRAINASMGGDRGRVGQSSDAVIDNIRRRAYLALARKDLNRQIRMSSFDQRRKNVTLSTTSKNNVAFSNLQISPSKTGAILKVLGSGIQNNIDAKVGTLSTSGKATQTTITTT